jgi:hypothetical protein
LPAITAPSSLAFSAICRSGVCTPCADLSAEALIVIVGFQLGKNQRRARQCHAATWHDAFLDCRKRCM